MTWTHSICVPCWNKREPDRPPVTVVEKEQNICCFCGELTDSGIFVREHPSKVPYCPMEVK